VCAHVPKMSTLAWVVNGFPKWPQSDWMVMVQESHLVFVLLSTADWLSSHFLYSLFLHLPHLLSVDHPGCITTSRDWESHRAEHKGEIKKIKTFLKAVRIPCMYYCSSCQKSLLHLAIAQHLSINTFYSTQRW
jgi:hypothetical protein